MRLRPDVGVHDIPGLTPEVYGFATVTEVDREVRRRALLDARDAAGLAALIAADPTVAVDGLRNWCDHPDGTRPLSYVAMLRYDTARNQWRDLPGTGELTRLLLDAGAPVDGPAGTLETPLMTAASYGDAAVAGVLLTVGADITAVAAPDAGGVPGTTALRHADQTWGRQALRVATAGRPASVRALLANGADPNLRDPDGATALDHCRRERPHHPDKDAAYAEVEAILTAPATARAPRR